MISSTSASLASLSSGDEESTTWDLTSEPHVTRSTINRLSRTNSGAYTSLADDESSESSTIGFAEGYGLRGTFQSTDRIRVRWAKPIKTREAPEAADGRRRVGIRDVTASMTCAVLGSPRFGRKGKNRAWDDHPIGHDGSIAMKLEYSATCKGVCFPGVATMLGMDIGLDVGDCEVEWAPEGDQKWSVTGGSGFTGYAVGPPAMPTLSHQSSEDFPSLNGYPSTPGTRSHVPLTNGHNTSHQGSTSISLMRAPLPVPQVPEYSFENSPSSSPASSLGSLATLPSSPEKNGRSRASYMNGASSSVSTDTDDSEPIRPPKAPITIHINMNDLLPPSKNVLTFHISGFIIVRPRNGAYFSPVRTTSPTQHRPGSPDSEPVSLPQFRVFSSDRESSSTLLQNEINEATLDVYNPTGHISDPQSRKTVLQPGGQTKCGSDGARIVVRPSIPSPPPPRRYSTSSARSSRVFADEEDEEDHFGGRKQNGFPVTPTPPSTSSKMMRETMLLGASISRPKRDGPLMVHSAVVTITPRPNTSIASRRGRRTEGWKVPREYAVRVCLPVPAEAESDWLEFGLALTPPTADGAKEKNKDPREVHVASASVESVPVKFETFAAMKPSSDLEKLNVPFERVSGKEWNTWVKVHVGESGGGMVEVVYLVNVSGEDEVEDRQKGAKWKGKEKEVDPTAMDVLLPIFSLPVGRLEVHIEAQTGMFILSFALVHRE